MYNKGKETIVKLSQFSEAHLDKTLERIYFHRNSSSLWFMMKRVEDHALTKGMYGYYIDDDASVLKQWFHVATKVRLANKWDELETWGFLLHALLSDHEEIIEAAARASSEKLRQSGTNPLYPEFHVRMIQQAILDDDDGVRMNISKLAKNGEKRYRKPAAAGTDFYSLLLERDQEGLQRLVQESAKIKSDDVLFENNMSYLGTLQAKLCWRRGIEIQVDSPLVPMELMPIRPLESYEDVYDFVDPNWMPPRQGMLGKIERWFRKKEVVR